MTREEIVAKVNGLLKEGFELSDDQLLPTASLKEDLGLDSLDAVDMIVILEEKIGTKIEGERLMQIRVLSDVYDLVGEKLLSDRKPKQELRGAELEHA